MFKEYKKLATILLVLNNNIIPLYQNKNQIIDLEIGKKLFYNLL